MAPRHGFETSLESMNIDLMKMGALVEEQLQATISALARYDIDSANKIIANDAAVDEYERVIERKCLGLIALQQPLARDLRTVSTALKLITDLERIGDHCADISELTVRMANDKSSKPIVLLFDMFNKAISMVVMSIDSYMRQDVELAVEVSGMDDIVDDYFDKIKKIIVKSLKNENQEVELAINSMFVTKYIERIADHATNIAEWALFMVTGEHISADANVSHP
jgi:phosphate transport system protein